jgi:hypothetical protein
MRDEFEVQAFNGTNALALDVVCDMTDKTVDSEVGFAIEIMDAGEVLAYGQNGQRAKIVRGSMNGSPPKTAVIIVATNNCKVGSTVIVGKGRDPQIAGSSLGFGIVWKDNTLMPTEMNHAMFASVDPSGNKWSQSLVTSSTDDILGTKIGVTEMENDYVISGDYGKYSNFMTANFGSIESSPSLSALNQPLTKPIIGSNNKAFTFLDNGEGNPVLHKVQMVSGTMVDEKVYQWGASAQGGAFSTTKGVQANGSWAFGMTQGGKVTIVVVKNDFVYPNIVNKIDGLLIDPQALTGAVLDSIVATDVGYVLAWWHQTNNGNYVHYLSYVPFNSMPDGIVPKTDQAMGWFGSNSLNRHDSLAWNGKYLGLLVANPMVGETNLILFKSDGVQVGDAVNIFIRDNGRSNYDPADLAASGNIFGIVSTSVTGSTAEFRPVNCNY